MGRLRVRDNARPFAGRRRERGRHVVRKERHRWGDTDRPVAVEVLLEPGSSDSSATLDPDITALCDSQLPLLSVFHTIY
jgi:hypothetical protein